MLMLKRKDTWHDAGLTGTQRHQDYRQLNITLLMLVEGKKEEHLNLCLLLQKASVRMTHQVIMYRL